MYQKTRFSCIYKAGNSYRFRKMVNGKRISRNFTRLKEALTFKKEMEVTYGK